MKTKVKKDCRPTCSECGGTNVEDTAWVAYREDGSAYIVSGDGPLDGCEGGTWCHDCEEHHDLIYPDVGGGWESEAARYRDRQQNEAARGHGPELLAVLQSVRKTLEQLEQWRELDATAVDQLIASDGLAAIDAIISKVTTGWEAT